MPNYYNQFYPTPPTQMNVGPTQNGGFMLVANEDIVKNYPVAPGTCVTFKLEGQPIVMEKSMGFSNLETPKIDKYRLIKEENGTLVTASEPHRDDFDADGINNSINDLKDEIEAIWEEIEGIKSVPVKKTNSRRKDDGGDD